MVSDTQLKIAYIVIEKIMENCSCTPNVLEISSDHLQQPPCRY